MYLFFLVALFTVCHSYVLNDVHYRSINGSGFVLLDEMDLSELSDEEIAMLRFSLIYPGTKWCGPGDTAENYEDLGVAEAEDRCCREHDYCPDTIVSGETKHNLTNDSYYTKLSCECDETFRQCLRQAASVNSKTIGTVYFNVIGTQCFRRDYPVTGCLKKGGVLVGLPRWCSASAMFAHARTDGFHTVLRRRIASLMFRTRSSPNSILKVLSVKLDSPLLGHWIHTHVHVSGAPEGGKWLLSKCVEYSYDKKGKKSHQWFDVPNYYD